MSKIININKIKVIIGFFYDNGQRFAVEKMLLPKDVLDIRLFKDWLRGTFRLRLFVDFVLLFNCLMDIIFACDLLPFNLLLVSCRLLGVNWESFKPTFLIDPIVLTFPLAIFSAFIPSNIKYFCLIVSYFICS